MQIKRLLYLSELELRNTISDGNANLQVIIMEIMVTHSGGCCTGEWEAGNVSDNQGRLNYDNLAASTSMELDSDGNIISMEEFYPYEVTVILTARSI